MVRTPPDLLNITLVPGSPELLGLSGLFGGLRLVSWGGGRTGNTDEAEPLELMIG